MEQFLGHPGSKIKCHSVGKGERGPAPKVQLGDHSHFSLRIRVKPAVSASPFSPLPFFLLLLQYEPQNINFKSSCHFKKSGLVKYNSGRASCVVTLKHFNPRRQLEMGSIVEAQMDSVAGFPKGWLYSLCILTCPGFQELSVARACR